MADPVLFDTQFTVSAIDPDGKKFERGEVGVTVKTSAASRIDVFLCIS